MTTDREIEQMIADCEFKTSVEQEQRVLEATGQVLQDRVATSRTPFRSSGIGLRLAAVASLVALILVALLLRESPHAVAWADVQQKVAEQEWILVRGKANDGETFESWTSISLKIDALKSGNSIKFVDYKNGFREVYDPVQKIVTRAKLDDGDDWEEDHSMLEMFNVIAKGDESVQIKSPSPKVEIVSQIRRKIERDGKTWIEFEMKLKGPGEETPTKMTFLIEPDSHLIRSMQLVEDERQMTAEFSYPKTGPRSLYDLDVPKSAEVIDRRPNDEMQALVDGVRSSAEKFGPYIALNVMQDADAPWYVGTPFKVWADGNKGRYESGLIDPQKNLFQKPEPDENQKLWWNNRWNQLWHHVQQVSDGQALHTDTAIPENWGTARGSHPLTSNLNNWPTPKWSNSSADGILVYGSPLSFAYSGHLDRAGWENIMTELDAHPESGPEGTVLITLKWKQSNPQDIREHRFWIDPEKSHIVMQIEYYSKVRDTTSSTMITNKELAKSPTGIWYPTLVSHKTITEKGGKPTETETITRHYLDFDTEFPEGVFEPKALPTGR